MLPAKLLENGIVENLAIGLPGKLALGCFGSRFPGKTMPSKIADYIEEVLGTGELARINKLTTKALGDLGFDKFSYLGTNPPPSEARQDFPEAFYTSTFVQTTYPEKWVNHYIEHGFYFIDPAIFAAKKRRLPFWWDGERSSKLVARSQKRVLREGRDFGIKRGAVIPVHAPNGEFGVLALATGQTRQDLEKLWRAKRHELHLIGLYFHAAIWENVFQRKEEAPPVLSPREVQCLEWTARGKTLWEVSKILGISEATAKTHLRGAIRKLGAANKTHAVARAISFGLVRI